MSINEERATVRRLAAIAADLNDNGPTAELPDWQDRTPRAEYLRGQMEMLATFAGIEKEAALVLIEAELIAIYINPPREGQQ